MVWDIITKFSPVVKLYGNPLCTKYEGYRCTKIWISRQNRQKHQMGVAGSIFEPHPPNFVRIQFFMSCKNAEIFVMISQLVPDLAKISVSETSISWDVLVLAYFHYPSNSTGYYSQKLWTYILLPGSLLVLPCLQMKRRVPPVLIGLGTFKW